MELASTYQRNCPMAEKYIPGKMAEMPRVLSGHLPSDILKHISRLDSASNTSVLSPAQRLNVAMEANFLGVKPVSKKHLSSQHVVTRAKRDVSAAVAFLDDKPEAINNPEVQLQVNRLRKIDEELLEFSKAVEDPAINAELKHIPHVEVLFKEYLKIRSVKPVLDGYYIPHDSNQDRSIRHFFTANTVENAFKRGLATLARRYVLSKWLGGGFKEIDSKIAHVAVYVLEGDFSTLSKQERDQVGAARIFLRQIMNAEFASIDSKCYGHQKDTIPFPQRYTGSDSDVLLAYKNFDTQHYCPLSLKRYARLVVDQVPIRDRVFGIFGPQNDSYNRMVDIDNSGISLPENTLISTQVKPSSQLLTFSTQKTLRKIKERMLELKV